MINKRSSSIYSDDSVDAVSLADVVDAPDVVARVPFPDASALLADILLRDELLHRYGKIAQALASRCGLPAVLDGPPQAMVEAWEQMLVPSVRSGPSKVDGDLSDKLFDLKKRVDAASASMPRMFTSVSADAAPSGWQMRFLDEQITFWSKQAALLHTHHVEFAELEKLQNAV